MIPLIRASLLAVRTGASLDLARDAYVLLMTSKPGAVSAAARYNSSPCG
jgi:hypothetical protein